MPWRVLADMAGDANVSTIIVRNGVVLHARGQLDLGRSTRVASSAQRRLLRALYPTCGIPDCDVRFDHCKIHHVVWWRHGGATDINNLIPICVTHHHRVHDHHWQLALGDDRTLSINVPDGTQMANGPPAPLRRRAA